MLPAHCSCRAGRSIHTTVRCLGLPFCLSSFSSLSPTRQQGVLQRSEQSHLITTGLRPSGLTLEFFLVKTPALHLLVFWPAAPPPLSTTSGPSHPRRLLPSGLLHGLFTTFPPAATAPPAPAAAEGSAAQAREWCYRCLVRTQQETSGLHSSTIC